MSLEIVSFKDYVVGWLDTSLHDICGVLPLNSASLRYALVTCLDSNPDPASLLETSPELHPLAARARIVGKGLLLPAKILLEADSRGRLFHGFDEVWFFPTDTIQAKPDLAWLVGPSRIDVAKLADLGEWMSDNSCSLALGDGDGTNLIVKARGLVKYLLGYTINQPQQNGAIDSAIVGIGQ